MQSAARGRQCQSLCGHDDNLHRFKFAHRKRMRNRSCSTYYTLSTRPLLIARQCFWWASLWKHYVDNVSNHHHVYIHNRFIILIDWLIERVAMLCVCVCHARTLDWADHLRMHVSCQIWLADQLHFIVLDLFACQRYKMHSPLTIQLDADLLTQVHVDLQSI